jgi:hypothetical protein
LPATPLAGARITAADAVTTSQAIPVPHCKVFGVIDTEVRFQVPHADLWNGRFVMGGNGGFAGSLDSEVISSVRLGYAAWTAKTGGEVFHAAEWEYAGTP